MSNRMYLVTGAAGFLGSNVCAQLLEKGEKLMAVNVTGTRNVITKCLAHPECEKMVYVSSTGAIPEAPMGTKIKEVKNLNLTIRQR